MSILFKIDDDGFRADDFKRVIQEGDPLGGDCFYADGGEDTTRVIFKGINE